MKHIATGEQKPEPCLTCRQYEYDKEGVGGVYHWCKVDGKRGTVHWVNLDNPPNWFKCAKFGEDRPTPKASGNMMRILDVDFISTTTERRK